MSLPGKRNCTGCGACSNICPSQAIKIEYDDQGFLFPNIDNKKCIHCKKCEKVCPVIVPLVNRNLKQPRVYACWNKNYLARKSSTSGGIFSAISENFFKKNGIVLSSRINNTNLEPEYIKVYEPSQLSYVRGSKYIQSKTKDIYLQIIQLIDNNQKIFFIGCPCQVAALYSFLRLAEKDTSNIFTADLVCHGVASYDFFREYIRWREHQARKKIISFYPRDKSRGWNNLTIKIEYEDGSFRLIPSDKDPFMRAYYAGLTYRESCYHCVYASLPRVGDVTLGDYFAICNDSNYKNEIAKGVSMVLVNNKKGEQIFEDIKSVISFRERSLKEALETNECLRAPTKIHKNRSAFFSNKKHNMNMFILRYCPVGFKSLMAKILGKRITKLVQKTKKKLYKSFKRIK